MHQGPERRGRPRKDNAHLVPKYEAAVRGAADRILVAHKRIHEATGSRPFRAKKTDDMHQLRQYLHVRDNVMAMGAIIQTHGLAKAIEYCIRMEKLLEKHPDQRDFLRKE